MLKSENVRNVMMMTYASIRTQEMPNSKKHSSENVIFVVGSSRLIVNM
jgi:hypothetical protein